MVTSQPRLTNTCLLLLLITRPIRWTGWRSRDFQAYGSGIESQALLRGSCNEPREMSVSTDTGAVVRQEDITQRGKDVQVMIYKTRVSELFT